MRLGRPGNLTSALPRAATTITERRVQASEPGGVNPLRARPAVRRLYARPTITAGDLMAPLLVLPEGLQVPPELPGAVPLSGVAAIVRRWAEVGIRGIKLFAYGHDRDARASGALAPKNRMLRGIHEVKAADPDMAVTTEVCGCSWTDHRQCVIRLVDGGTDLEATYRLMAEMAVQHAEAGADMVSPTAMLDGSVRAVRAALDTAGHRDVGVNPNLALHTTLYGPFKQLMDTEPAAGHRRDFQLEPGRAERDTLVQARRWIAEGADSLTLQPVMTAVDVLVRLRADQEVPLIAYSTSGEWAPLQQLGSDSVTEYHAALKRAGADLILTFAAEQVARALGRSHG